MSPGPLRRALHPALNAPGLMAAAGAVCAAAVMITNAVHHHGIIDPPVIVAAISAVAALLTRSVVTPVADPKNGAGQQLVPAGPAIIPWSGPEPPWVAGLRDRLAKIEDPASPAAPATPPAAP